jgi:hypothetical protein
MSGTFRLVGVLVGTFLLAVPPVLALLISRSAPTVAYYWEPNNPHSVEGSCDVPVYIAFVRVAYWESRGDCPQHPVPAIIRLERRLYSLAVRQG